MFSVLIVDDEPTVSLVVRLALEHAGYEVEVALDGEEGLERVRNRDFDVIITDVQMPKMDGREMCQQICAEFPDRKPILFVITGRSELEVREWALDLPDCEFIHKPVSMRRMIATIRERLGQE